MDPVAALQDRLKNAEAAVQRHNAKAGGGGLDMVAVARLEGKVAAYREALALLGAEEA